jgi:metabolite-proton symporter
MTAAAAAPRRDLRTIIGASMIGTTIEWYDFFLYGSAAALVFNKLFFPNTDPGTGTLYAFVTYAVGFAARPIGGLVFGHFGDRIGRKRLLMISLLMMGASTVLMGFLPTYDQVGQLAPILLVLLRVVQGFAVGGEWGGAVLLVAEHGSKERRGFWTSWPQMGVAAGNLLATGVLLIMAKVQPENEFLRWGWRLPFLLSAILIGIGWWVRSTVAESPIFSDLQARAKVDRAPALEVIRKKPRELLIGAGVRFAENLVFYIFTTFAIAYITGERHLSRQLALNAVMFGSVMEMVAIPAFGALSDRVGRKPVYAFGALFTAIFAFAFFPMIDTNEPLWISLAIMVALIPHSAMYGVQASLLSELFPTRMRYSGVSLASQLTSIFAGSLAPIIAQAIMNRFHSPFWITIYVAAAGLLSFVSTLLAKETRGVSFDVIDAEP